MICPDCKATVLSFDEYCKKCGADLYTTKQVSQLKKVKGVYRAF
ncbi:MAG TPA: hypothetical protein VF531_13335 [Bacillota bacterium]